MSGTDDVPSSYRLKKIRFEGKEVSILLQNLNGPCPLIAIFNALILRGKVAVPNDHGSVSLSFVLNLMAEHMFAAVQADAESGANPAVLANQRANLDDAISIQSSLARGLDVNVKFSAVDAFEYTRELAVFDLCGCRLFHGWLPTDQHGGSFGVAEGQENGLARYVSKLSYNRLIEKTINLPEELGSLNARVEEARARGEAETVSRLLNELESSQMELMALQEFLRTTSSQFTFAGLAALHEAVKDGQTAVLFRNNHFSTLYCKDRRLFTLVADEGFQRENGIVWEHLCEIDGDSEFVDADFQPHVARSHQTQAEDVDRQLAMQLYEEELRASRATPPARGNMHGVGQQVNSRTQGSSTDPTAGGQAVYEAVPVSPAAGVLQHSAVAGNTDSRTLSGTPGGGGGTHNSGEGSGGAATMQQQYHHQQRQRQSRAQGGASKGGCTLM